MAFASFLISAVFLSATALAEPVPSSCGSGEYKRRVSVSTATQLRSALSAAVSGDLIMIRAGTYLGSFVLQNKIATSSLRIFICGESGTVFKASKAYSGYGLHIKNSKFIRVANIEITGYLKGVMLDKTSGTILQGLYVHHIGTEGVHFRTHSSSNLLMSSEIAYTGLTEDWFGEGVYIGSSVNNWCTYTNCAPDRSNGNKVRSNYIHHTGAESIDIKEGTERGLIEGNVFHGAMMTGEYADSFIDVKGNGYTISSNVGTVGYVNSVAAQKNGFQVHVISSTPSGNGNIFKANEVIGNLSGYIVDIQSTAQNNVVSCDHKATRSKGITNRPPCVQF
jgi:hypothetical protein